ncbi:MAG: hypothetical protein WD607_05215, partial [Candidatus Paceibacterota bacterium]
MILYETNSFFGRCVGAKANVLHCVGFERWDAALLILLKRWHFVYHFSVRLLSVVSSFRVRHNGSALGVRAGFRRTKLS